MKKTLTILAVAALLGGGVLMTAGDADAWGFNMNGNGGGYGGGWGGNGWGGGYGGPGGGWGGGGWGW